MPSIFSNSIINKSNVSLLHMQYLSSLYLVSLLKFFQGREADFCDTLQECTLLSRSLVEAWHGKSCFYGMNHSRGRKSLSKNVRWKLLKHNKLSYDFRRNIFENPFTNSSFFFSPHIMNLSTSCYTTLYWKDSCHHTDSNFLGPSPLS